MFLEKLTSSQSRNYQHLWNWKVHFRICKLSPTVPSLSQSNPVHTTTSHFLKIHLNIILPSMPGSSKWFLPFRLPHQNYKTLLSPYVPYAPPISFFSIWSSEQYWVSSTDHSAPHYIVSPLPCYLVPLRPKHSPQHPILIYPRPMFLPQCKWPSFTHSQHTCRTKYNS